MLNSSKTSSVTGTSQRAAIACQSCRLRKVKCDAQFVSPAEACGPCRRAGQECLLDPLSDGRRSVSRVYVDKLQQRIQTLEALNKRTVDRSAWRPNEDGPTPPAHAAMLPCGPGAGPSTATSNTAPSQNNGSDNAAEPAPPKACSTTHLSSSSLATRNSPEKARGESPSFYGATCHPHVVSPGDESRLTSFDEVDTVGVDLDPTSPHLREHLIQSFFNYQTLWVDIVNKESFLTHQANGNHSRWFSRFLENAMLACGTRLSTSKAVRALGAKYCDQAKEQALTAMSEPSPANLQGFLLLSEYEVTQGNDRPGWMFCGMYTAQPETCFRAASWLTSAGVACRMLSDLGLHELASTVSAPSEARESTKESDLAYALLSACVVYEGVWTLYLGRPSSIPRLVMATAASRCKAGRKSDSPWLNAWVGLCVPMAEISHLLNDKSVSDSEAFSSLRKLSRQMQEWYGSLPPELAYNENRVTNMDLAGYGLHTQYCKVQILLRRALDRPVNCRKRQHSQITSDKTSQTISDDSSVVIYHYALRIARLVVTYREAFGIEKIPSIMLDNAVVAATVMIGHINNSRNGDDMPQETTWLRQLVKCMETVQPHFPVVGRMLDTLKQICSNSSLSNIIPLARRDSMTASTQGLQTHDQSNDLSSISNNMRIDPDTMRNHADNVWDYFDADVTSNVFLSGGYDDFILDLPPLQPLISDMARVARPV